MNSNRNIRHLILSALLIWYCGLELYSQNIYVSDRINNRRNEIEMLIGRVGPNIVMTSHSNTRLQIYLFDDHMRRTSVSEKNIDTRRGRIQGVYGTTDNLHVVYTSQERDTLYFIDRAYSPSLAEQADDTIGFFILRFFRPEIRISQSEDNNTLGIVLSSNSNVEHIMSYDLLNRRTLQSKYVDVAFDENRDRLRRTMVTTSGDIFIIGESNNIRSRMGSHEFSVHIFHVDSDSYVTQRINVPSFLTFDADFYYDERLHTIAIGGLYSTDRGNEAEGLFFLDIDPYTADSLDIIRIPFTTSFLKTYYNKNKIKSNSAYNLAFQKIMRRQDGGYLLFFEELSQFSRGFNGAPVGVNVLNDNLIYYTTDYHYEDLYVYSINPKGKLDWEVSIPKNQYSSDDEGVFSSFFLFENRNHLRVIYNDEVKRNNTISEVVLLSDGYSRRNTLLSIPSNNLLIQVSNGIQISPNEIIFPATENGNLKLAKFEFLQ